MQNNQTLLSNFFSGLGDRKRKKRPRKRVNKIWIQLTLIWFFPELVECLRQLPRYFIVNGKKWIPDDKKGTLSDLFSMNNLQFWDREHKALYHSNRGRPPYPLKSIFKMLIAGIKQGRRDLTNIVRLFKDNQKLARLCDLDPNNIPHRSTLSKILTRLTPDLFRKFHQSLISEGCKEGLITLKALSGDTTLLKTNCSGKPIKVKLNEKELERLPFANRPNAEVRRIERYSDTDGGWKIRNDSLEGFGLTHFTITDASEELTVHYDLFYGSIHDSHIVKPGFSKYFDWTPRMPDAVSLDNGFQSPGNSSYFHEKGVKVAIMARSNQKDTVVTPTGKHYKRESVCGISREDLDYLARKRTASERDYARGKRCNNMSKTMFRGRFKSLIWVGLIHIAEAMTAMTAKNIGKLWLRRRPTAFSAV